MKAAKFFKIFLTNRTHAPLYLYIFADKKRATSKNSGALLLSTWTLVDGFCISTRDAPHFFIIIPFGDFLSP